jgi:hypothetical protein
MTDIPAPTVVRPQPQPLLLRIFFSTAWGTLVIVLSAAA